MLIDTHAHLFWESYKEDFDEVLKRCLENDVTTIVNVGTEVSTSEDALRLAEDTSLSDKNIKFYSTVGIHPHEAIKFSGQNLESRIQEETNKLERIYYKNPEKVVGVGECGLDFFFDPEFQPADLSLEETKKLQKTLFQSQIDLAKKLNLPLSIHCRDDRSKNLENVEAWEDCLEMIKDERGVLHCYSGTEVVTKKALDLNFYFSFAGNITYPKNDYLKMQIKLIPLEKIVLETDCPFLSPQSNRGKRNEPIGVIEVAKLISEIKGLSIEEVEDQTTQNAKKLFSLN